MLQRLGNGRWFALGTKRVLCKLDRALYRVSVGRLIPNAGWERWSPMDLAAISAHLIGGGGILHANKGRVAGQIL